MSHSHTNGTSSRRRRSHASGQGSSSSNGGQSQAADYYPPSTELRVQPAAQVPPNRSLNAVLTWSIQGDDPEPIKNHVQLVSTQLLLYKIQTVGGSEQYLPMAHGTDFATAGTVRNPCQYSEGFYHNGYSYRRYDFVWTDLEIRRQGKYYLEFMVMDQVGTILGRHSSNTFRVVNDASARPTSREQALLDMFGGDGHEERGVNVLESMNPAQDPADTQ